MYLSIDIGGTNIKSGIIREADITEILDKKEFPTNAKKIYGIGIEKKIVEIIESYRKKYSIDGVAISTAGVVNPKTYEIEYANENIPYYIGINLSETVQKTFNIPCIVENDVNCAAIGEIHYGSGKGYSNLFCLTVGTGIGGSIIIDGNLYHGSSFTAGEIGYMKIDGADFQDVASTSFLVNRVKELTGFDLNGKEIFEKALAGNASIQQIIDEFCENLVKGIVTIYYVLNPEKIIIGGGIMEQTEYLSPIINNKIQMAMERFNHKRIDITFANLGNDAGMVGAYHLLKSYLGEEKRINI
ncbi:ROK family protein [Bacillus sp. FJAT-50079]|uniref:ROK family protein n=1 Tax=Bacillus sp. FJAT-50079 TaxID=2833577 RepID=UPI001BC9402D|nr:ROK family protein [Bacillus sp. FJAT-50079]MBS4206677.1 ROK family protein [Bacillus sp. FJAT-50079]